MKNGILRLWALTVVTILYAAAGSIERVHAESIEVEHFQGRTTVEIPPAKVFVYDLGVLDMLHALSVPVRGVPGSNVPDSLARYRADDYLKIGTLFEPDYETINAEKPDLIFIGPRTSAKYTELSGFAPVVDLSDDEAHFVEDVKKNARTIGRIFAKEDEIESRIARLDQSVEALRQEAKHMGTALVILATGGKLSAYGPKSRFGMLHEAFGIPAADPNLHAAVHGQAISYEYLLSVNPDWLLVIDRDAAVGTGSQTARQLLDNELVHRTRAWRQGHVIYLDPVRMYLTSGSLNAQQQIVDEIDNEIREKSKP